MKFIIYWILTVAYPTSCGSPPPTIDEFGRETSCNCSYASICYRYEKEKHSKVFHDFDSARSFYNIVVIESKKKYSDISEVIYSIETFDKTTSSMVIGDVDLTGKPIVSDTASWTIQRVRIK